MPRLVQDLHDGTQLRLAMCLVTIDQLIATSAAQPCELTELALELRHEMEGIIDELRRLVEGAAPPVLASGGLEDAMLGLARAMPTRATLQLYGVKRYDRNIERALYFTCLEAVQNSLKHAHGAGIAMSLTDADGQLVLTVHDKGPGIGSVTRPGLGLASMHDRVDGVGGRLEIRSAPDDGTRVRAIVPARRHPS